MKKSLKSYLKHLKLERGCSDNTIDSYSRDLEKLIVFLKGKNISDLSQVSRELVKNFVESMHIRKLSNNSIRHHITVCRSFFRFLKKNSVIANNCFEYVESPKVQRKKPDILDLEEVIDLIERPDTDSKYGLRDQAILELLYGTGLRVSELGNLKFENIDLDQKLIKVLGKGGVERIVPLNAHCLIALSTYWLRCRFERKPKDYIFTTFSKNKKPVDRINVWRTVKKYASQCGFKDKNIHPHTIRRCYATHLLDNGADLFIVKDLLGHSDISTTGLYVQPSLNSIIAKFNKHHPRNPIIEESSTNTLQVG